MIKQVLEQMSCGEVVKHQSDKLVTATLGEGLQAVTLRMSQHKISALPVFDDQGKLAGLLDFGDIVSFILTSAHKHGDADGALGDSQKFWQFLAHSTITPAVLNCSGGNATRRINLGDSVYRACEVFAEEEGKARRLVVVDHVKVVGLLSPSTVCKRLLEELKGGLDPQLLQTVDGLCSKEGNNTVPRLVSKTCLVMDAMAEMQRHHVPCVAVVDPLTNALAGSLSLSDIKLVFSQQDFGILKLSAWDFIILNRGLLDQEQFPFIGIGRDAILVNLIHKLLATKVHNIYIVDKQLMPTQVVGFPLVCRGFLS
ncbi:hypothetical protein BASA81_005881 [Batrachochytrium salamandrivorans]|nr:hypothetical protein BASA81_005881 [Batrachochytrium salamandrivorans]